MKFVFDGKDQQWIEQFLTRLESRTGLKRSLDDLVQKWSDFVSEIETGYDLYIEDYENDLCVRDILQEVIEGLSPVGREALERLIESIDYRFLQATTPVERPLLPPVDKETVGFWWYRIPKNLGEDLLRDLRQEGFI
ncbi:MAG: hypothetical protein QXT58_04575 [Archaeoglobaceae archaeon]